MKLTLVPTCAATLAELRTALRLFMTYSTQGVQVWQNTTDLTWVKKAQYWSSRVWRV